MTGVMQHIQQAAPLPGGAGVFFRCRGERPALGLQLFGASTPAWEISPGAPGPLACSPDGTALAAMEWAKESGVVMGGGVSLFDAAGGGPIARPFFCGSPGVTGVAVAPGGRAVACIAGQFLHFHRLAPTPDSNHHRLNERPYLGIAWHPSGGFFATAKGDGNVDFWDGVTGERRESFGWGVGTLNDVVFDATGDRAAVCTDKGKVVVWDIDR
jgi:WD40 repeat protein